MTRSMALLLWIALGMAGALPVQAYAPACLRATPIPLRVRIGDAALPVDALLRGGSAPALAVIERDTGRLLWSAGATPPAAQQFPAMRAAFSGSLAALDLDGDGLHDRLYAGDLGGRVWRFDLHHGAPAGSWATGGVFADFSNAAGRGFIAAPDVSLSAPPGDAPWFNIALGTAAPGNVATSHRYYVLRDHAPFDAWNADDYGAWQPVRETDLVRLTEAGDTRAGAIEDGYFIELARGEVLSSSITVAGRAVLAIADSTATPATQCRVVVSTAAVEVDEGTAATARDGAPWREPLSGSVTAGTAFTFSAIAAQAAPCTLGGMHVAACDVDTRPMRTWWRREDAE